VISVVLLVACGGTPEERVTEEYANEVKVQHFRLTDTDSKAEDVTLNFVGPSNLSPGKVVRAPGFSFEKSPPASRASGGIYDYLAEGYGIPFRGMRCRMTVTRLKDGIKPLESMDLTPEETTSVQNGKSVVLEITVGCRSG
jgi:hypothetical protein